MAKKVIQPPEPEVTLAAQEPEVTLAAQEPELQKRHFVATRVAMWHPFKGVRIENLPIELEYDSWVASQHQAGMLKEVY